MKIRDILKKNRTVSIEFFPPKTQEGIPALFRAIDRLKQFQPSYVSVTCGAGGSTRDLTEEISLGIKRQVGLEVMTHVTCSGQSKDDVIDVLGRLEQEMIDNVIGLRGDPPRGQADFIAAEGGFAHATDLIEHMKSNFGFGIAAACYPEGHPESPDIETDLAFTRKKVDAGAEFLITQLFFSNDDFFAFRDRARKAGITVPIVAGVLPILSSAQIRRFTELCGATIPKELDSQLDRFVDDDHAARELGVEYTTDQVRELWDNGAEGIHFYSLNRSYSISKILRNLGLPDHSGEAADVASS